MMLRKWESVFAAAEEVIYWGNDCTNVTLEEVGQATRNLANGKMTGEDNIPNEFYKYEGKPLIQLLYQFIYKCWLEKTFPDKIKKAQIILLYKKGSL